MAGNSIGGGGASFRTSMKAFDQLPAAVREALNYAVEDWSAYGLHKRFERGRFGSGTKATRAMVATVNDWDREELAKRADQKATARGPYKGNAPEPGHEAWRPGQKVRRRK